MAKVFTVREFRDTRSEKEVEASGDKMMSKLGFQVIRFSQARATMQTRGISDRRYMHMGRGLAVWWEAKREGGTQSYDQAVFQRVVEACGEHYVVGTDAALEAWVLKHFMNGVTRGAHGNGVPVGSGSSPLVNAKTPLNNERPAVTG